jgi:hypothetical protein
MLVESLDPERDDVPSGATSATLTRPRCMSASNRSPATAAGRRSGPGTCASSGRRTSSLRGRRRRARPRSRPPTTAIAAAIGTRAPRPPSAGVVGPAARVETEAWAEVGGPGSPEPAGPRVWSAATGVDGVGVGFGVGFSFGFGFGVGVGPGIGLGVGPGVGSGVGLGVTAGAGAGVARPFAGGVLSGFPAYAGPGTGDRSPKTGPARTDPTRTRAATNATRRLIRPPPIRLTGSGRSACRRTGQRTAPPALGRTACPGTDRARPSPPLAT